MPVQVSIIFQRSLIEFFHAVSLVLVEIAYAFLKRNYRNLFGSLRLVKAAVVICLVNSYRHEAANMQYKEEFVKQAQAKEVSHDINTVFTHLILDSWSDKIRSGKVNCSNWLLPAR